MNSNGKRPNARQNVQGRVVSQPVSSRNDRRREQTNQRQKSPANSKAQPPRQVARRSAQATDKPGRQSGLSDNLRSQTPLNRQMRKKTAPNEPGTVRRTNTQYFRISQKGKKRSEGKRIKKKRSFAKRVVLLGMIGYLILLPIALLTAVLLLKANVAFSTDDFKYQLGEGRSTLSRKTYSYFRIYRDGVYYIDMDSIADYCELTTTGDGKNMRYVVRESAESVEFVIGESIAYVNGVPERTGGNAFLYDGSVHVPLEFAKRCFRNLDISLDTENNSITIVRKTDEKGKYLPLVFPYKLTDNADMIVFGDLQVEIQEQIIKQNQPTSSDGVADSQTDNNNF